jgi:hypothetical protein
MLCTGCTRLEFILRDSQVDDVALCMMSPLKNESTEESYVDELMNTIFISIRMSFLCTVIHCGLSW